MFELFQIHAGRRSMFRQEMMAQEQEQEMIHHKLKGDIPFVNDTYNQVLDIYERTKGHNFLFRTYFGVAEYTAKAIAGTTVPLINYGFGSHIERANNVACSALDSLQEQFPIITRPTEEVIRESKEQYDKVAPVVEPLLLPAKVALKVGQKAVNVGTTVTSTAMMPAVYAVKVSSALTSAVVETSQNAASQVAKSVIGKGQEMVEGSFDTPLGRFWLEQFDVSLDSIETLLFKHYLPDKEEDGEVEGEEREGPATRKERVQNLALRIHNAVYKKAKGDMVRYRLLATSFMQELVEITGHYFTLLKDGSSMLWAQKEKFANAVDVWWNKYVQFIPENVRPTDPTKRLFVLVNFLVGKLGELLAECKDLPAFVQQAVSNWCQRPYESLQKLNGEVHELRSAYVTELMKFYPFFQSVLSFLVSKVVNSVDVLKVDVPADLSEMELNDVAMGNAGGMGRMADPQMMRLEGNFPNFGLWNGLDEVLRRQQQNANPHQ